MKVKILGLSCAYKNEPDVPWLVQYALKAVDKFGKRINKLVDMETEFIDLADREIKPCGDCQIFCIPDRGHSRNAGSKPQDFSCIIEDDYMMELMPKIAEADGFIFGSSVSNHSFSTKFRVLTERLTEARFKGYLADKRLTRSKRTGITKKR